MTHDPLCQVVTITKVIDAVLVLPGTDLSTTNLGKTVTYEEGECTCELVARVREDERKAAAARVTDLPWLDGGRTVNWGKAIKAARGDRD